MGASALGIVVGTLVESLICRRYLEFGVLEPRAIIGGNSTRGVLLLLMVPVKMRE